MSHSTRRATVLGAVATALTLLTPHGTRAAKLPDCKSALGRSGKSLILQSDCTTSQAITIPDGFTLNGQDHTISAIDPDPAHGVYFTPFEIVTNGGSRASVRNVKLQAKSVGGPTACRALWGIYLNHAGAMIDSVQILETSHANHDCPTGFGIEADGELDASAPALPLTIKDSSIAGYESMGAYFWGALDVTMDHNKVSAALPVGQQAYQTWSVYYDEYTRGTLTSNTIAGNEDLGTSGIDSRAILISYASGVTIGGTSTSHKKENLGNTIGGNSNVAIDVEESPGTKIIGNSIADQTADTSPDRDIGIRLDADSVPDSVVSGNTLRCFDTAITIEGQAADALGANTVGTCRLP